MTACLAGDGVGGAEKGFDRLATETTPAKIAFCVHSLVF
jgi:hypothetical protein